jgi:hypothetical protein
MSDDGSHERLYNPDGWGCPKDILGVLAIVIAVCSLGWWLA